MALFKSRENENFVDSDFMLNDPGEKAWQKFLCKLSRKVSEKAIGSLFSCKFSESLFGRRKKFSATSVKKMQENVKETKQKRVT